jgi:hypothetical protein
MTEPLAADFPPVPDDEWRAAALKAAKAPDDTPTRSLTEDGIEVQWLYTREDALASDPGGVPGLAPFVRGTGGGTKEHETAWEIRQQQAHPDRRAANKALMEDLVGGATAIELRPDRAARGGHAPGTDAFAATRGVDGTMISTVDDLETVLEGVFVELAPIAIDGGAQAVATGARSRTPTPSARSASTRSGRSPPRARCRSLPPTRSPPPGASPPRSPRRSRRSGRSPSTPARTSTPAPPRSASSRSRSPPASPTCVPPSRPGCSRRAPRRRSSSR